MSGSGGSGRRGDARRRRRSAGYESERFHGHVHHGEDPLQRNDAWRTWLETMEDNAMRAFLGLLSQA